MKRSVAIQATRWTILGTKRVFVSARSAYYAIAKEMVMAKYPPGIVGENVDIETELESAERLGVSLELYRQRKNKAIRLFGAQWAVVPDTLHGEYLVQDHGGTFDWQKLKRVLNRVAKFMEWADRRRGYQRMTDEDLSDFYEAAERSMTYWTEQTHEIATEIKRRDRG